MEITIGTKYKGRPIEETPIEYLFYILDELPTIDVTLSNAIKNFLVEKYDLYKPIGDKMMNYMSQESFADEDKLKTVYRKLVKKYHPDMGGNDYAMAALSEFKAELLKETL